jgi:hypothetical protein
MSSPQFEAFLTRLYVDAEARQQFLVDPQGAGHRAGLTEKECEALARIDRIGLQMAAFSFKKKREKSQCHFQKLSLLKKILTFLKCFHT